MTRSVRDMPAVIAVLFWMFLALPVLSIAFVEAPWSTWQHGHAALAALGLAAYWLGPIGLCTALLRRSFAALPLFALECLSLVAHGAVAGNLSPELTAFRYILLAVTGGVGLMILNRDTLFPFLLGGNRLWRRAMRVRWDARLSVKIEADGDALVGRLTNYSSSGVGMHVIGPIDAGVLKRLSDGATIEVVDPASGARLALTCVWVKATSDGIDVGARTLHFHEMEFFIEQLAPLPEAGFWSQTVPRLLAQTHVRRTAVALWSANVVGALLVPACGGIHTSHRSSGDGPGPKTLDIGHSNVSFGGPAGEGTAMDHGAVDALGLGSPYMDGDAPLKLFENPGTSDVLGVTELLFLELDLFGKGPIVAHYSDRNREVYFPILKHHLVATGDLLTMTDDVSSAYYRRDIDGFFYLSTPDGRFLRDGTYCQTSSAAGGGKDLSQDRAFGASQGTIISCIKGALEARYAQFGTDGSGNKIFRIVRTADLSGGQPAGIITYDRGVTGQLNRLVGAFSSVQLTYGDGGRLVKIVGPTTAASDVVDFGYTNGRLTSITQPGMTGAARTATVAYDANGRLMNARAMNGRSTLSYGRIDGGTIATAAVVAVGGSLLYAQTYCSAADGDSYLMRRRTPVEMSVPYVTSSTYQITDGRVGPLTSLSGPLPSDQLTIVPDDTGYLIRSAFNAKGVGFDYEYEDGTTLRRRITHHKTGIDDRVMTYGPAPRRLIQSMVEPFSGNRWTYSWDAKARLIGLTGPGVSQSTVYVESDRRLEMRTTTNGMTAKTVIDENGRPLSVTAPSGASIANTYEGEVLASVKSLPSNDQWDGQYFDATHWLKREESTGGVASLYQYSDGGAMTSAVTTGSSTTMRWDNNGTLTYLERVVGSGRSTTEHTEAANYSLDVLTLDGKWKFLTFHQGLPPPEPVTCAR